MTVRSGAGKFLRENLLLIATLLGVVLGIGLGIGLYFAKPGDTLLLWIGFPGELVLRAFKLLILPLVVSCVINITASSSIKANGTMGGLAMLYIVTTNLIGALLGLLFVVLIQPGSSDQEGGGSGGGGGGEPPVSRLVVYVFLTQSRFPYGEIHSKYRPKKMAESEICRARKLAFTQ
ncbi:hypothetical protein BOX15_Mlig019478g1 [Macrostomum lignano]|uniref:Amino acid transporter n=2 Tax=Macrostomum lignano TaxID=282301 RepID=A0A267FZY9_9PLAT|nr:hypothetical protein BOX15_Mlig019478g1 [Macrostomum lignano]